MQAKFIIEVLQKKKCKLDKKRVRVEKSKEKDHNN